MSENESNDKIKKDSEFDYGVASEIVRLNTSFKNPVLTPAERSRKWRLKKKAQRMKPRAKTPAERTRKHRLKYKQLLTKLAQCSAQASDEDLLVPIERSRLNKLHTVPPNAHQDNDLDTIQQPNSSQITRCNIINQQPHIPNIAPNTVEVPHLIRDLKNGRSTQRTEEVAINQNVIDTNIICSRSIDRVLNIDIAIASIGDLCSVSCVTEDHKNIIIVAIHIFPNQTMHDIVSFIHKKLLIYTKEGSALLTENLCKVPLILIGEFNVSFSDEVAQPLLEFFNKRLALQKISIENLAESTTPSESVIDGVFARFINKIDVQSFISYYNYLEPIIRFSKCDQSDIIVTED